MGATGGPPLSTTKCVMATAVATGGAAMGSEVATGGLPWVVSTGGHIKPCKSTNTLGYRNHKSCKILPKFLPTLHFLQESYKFVQESQILQSCYNVEHFLQDSDNIFAKIAFLRQKFLQKLQCVISTKSSFKTVTFVQFCVFFE